ncbi:prepilin peptidase [Paludibacterium sp.]|uniref:A24 family peptidase n=1 Tax=Paludibacterium sp. TaxID=1917523 RepID=UPI0025FC84B2|nr:prepilin peptidase [Paludibacterium sp.]MBV8648636.1 prepilin peptidase [Paludibacterium sp.]
MGALVLQHMPPLPVMCTLLGLLIWAVTSDLSSRRIPNALILAGLALAWQAQCLALGWRAGSVACLAGAGVGLALMLPGHLLRMAGAGDVKLMAMVGAFFGAAGALQVGLAAMLAGGGLSLLWLALRPGAQRFNLRWLTLCLAQPGVWLPGRRQRAVRERMPYGVAIALGCAAVLWLSA